MSSENKEKIEFGAEIERLDRLDEPPPPPVRQGFLPMDTNLFDRCFISVMCLVIIHLVWLRFVEWLLPLGLATVLSLVLAYVIIRRG